MLNLTRRADYPAIFYGRSPLAWVGLYLTPTAHRLTGVLQTLETRGTVRENSSLGVPAHICAVGLYCKATRSHLRHTRIALATEPRSNKQQYKIAASLRPKGSLSPLKGTIATKATSCQVSGGLTRMLQEIPLCQRI